MANGQTSQTLIRMDEDTRMMLEQMVEHYTGVFGSSDLSFAARACIRSTHKNTYPDRWHGEYFKPEATNKVA